MFCCFHSKNVITLLKINFMGQDSVVGIATRYWLDSPDRPWGPSILQHNGYRLCLPVVKWPANFLDNPSSYTAQVIERVQLHLSSASWTSWQVIR